MAHGRARVGLTACRTMYIVSIIVSTMMRYSVCVPIGDVVAIGRWDASGKSALRMNTGCILHASISIERPV